MAADQVQRFTAEAEDARTRMASTIDEIQERLDPRRIIGEAVDRVSGGGLQLVGQARDMARAHPLALGAAVAAVGIALLARNTLSKARVNLGDDLGAYTDYDDGFGYAESDGARLYFDEAEDDEIDGDAAERPRQRPARVAARARARADRLATRAESTIDSSPITSIILGLAAGAALGALFPSTEAERRAVGETGQKLGAAARAAARRAADELDAHGLSMESVRAKAGDAKRKARAAAQSVVDAARDELKS